MRSPRNTQTARGEHRFTRQQIEKEEAEYEDQEYAAFADPQKPHPHCRFYELYGYEYGKLATK